MADTQGVPLPKMLPIGPHSPGHELLKLPVSVCSLHAGSLCCVGILLNCMVCSGLGMRCMMYGEDVFRSSIFSTVISSFKLRCGFFFRHLFSHPLFSFNFSFCPWGACAVPWLSASGRYGFEARVRNMPDLLGVYPEVHRVSSRSAWPNFPRRLSLSCQNFPL